MINSAESGQYAAAFGPVGSDGILSQDIPTIAGQHYTLDFWLANAGGGPDDFAVKWNGQTLASLVNNSAQGYTEYQFDVVGTAGTSRLEFDFRQDPSYWSLDNVSLTLLGQYTASFATSADGSGATVVSNPTTPTLTQTLAPAHGGR